jgi:hypothetical protein
MSLGWLRRIAVDVSPMRESRDFRLLALGQIVSSLGTQAALVALPYQIFVLSHSARCWPGRSRIALTVAGCWRSRRWRW